MAERLGCQAVSLAVSWNERKPEFIPSVSWECAQVTETNASGTKRKVPVSGGRGRFCSVLLAFESLRITTVVTVPLRRTQEELRAFSRAFVRFVSIAHRAHGAPRQDWTDFI